MGTIVTGWCGDEWREIASLTVPRMKNYAGRHGYDFEVYEFTGEITRAASWKKLLAIASEFEIADEVLWLDADVLIVDGSEDIAFDFQPGMSQAMVRHSSPEGDVPNAGVWFLDRRMLGTLMACAMDDRFVNHKWWEQAAILCRMGFEERDGMCHHKTPTPLYRATHWLDESWNVWKGSPATVRPKFVHACGVVQDRIGYLRGFL